MYSSSITNKNYVGLNGAVVNVIDNFLACMFPNFYGDNKHDAKYYEGLFCKYLLRVMSYFTDPNLSESKSKSVVSKITDELPTIKKLLESDIHAAYVGDPAARNADEVILCYPAFVAISVYRIAHVLYNLDIPVVPRMMTERVHSLTGIDIHPGATIGSHFFIDHGTGVVIGETTTIGDNVKLYQHVTLGALSFEVGEDGTLVKGIKRHPDIGNNVVIYAGATILGGSTKIGDNAVIGGGTWIVKSVEAGATITQKPF